jgi:hypothetical protein
MDDNPWKTKSPFNPQENSILLCNAKVHYTLHNSSQLICFVSQMSPVHNISPIFVKIKF